MLVKGYKIDRADEDEMPSWEQNVQSYLYHRLLYEGQATAWGEPKGTRQQDSTTSPGVLMTGLAGSLVYGTETQTLPKMACSTASEAAFVPAC